MADFYYFFYSAVACDLWTEACTYEVPWICTDGSHASYIDRVFFLGQMLKLRIAIILGRREYNSRVT